MAKVAKKSSLSLHSIVFWAACFALIASFTVFVLEKSQITNFYTKPVSVNQASASNGPTNIIDYPISSSNSNSGSPSDKQSGTDKPSNSDTLSGAINYKAVVNDNLVIRATIYQIISSGTCSLKLTRSSDGKQISRTAEVVQNPSSATCKGFDVPVSELGSGEWKISLVVNSGDKTGEITGEISL